MADMNQRLAHENPSNIHIGIVMAAILDQWLKMGASAL
ncbi:hypothetical protein EMIT0194P_130130 [Pseudomonas serbica]|jgi:hypothetical protein